MSASTPAAQANLSAVSVTDLSVWMFDYDDPAKKTEPTMMETIYAFLFSKAMIILFYSVILSLVLPTCVNTAIQASRSIPWMSLSARIIDSLRRVLCEQPTLLLASIL
jgi:hypothetical protein